MAITLYINKLSPPARACMMTAKVLGLDVDYKELDLIRGDHKKEEFLKVLCMLYVEKKLLLIYVDQLSTYGAHINGRRFSSVGKRRYKHVFGDSLW